MTKREIVKKFLNGFNDSSMIQESSALLAIDYKFKNPMIELNSKADFMLLAQKMGAILKRINIIGITESENWVTVLYEFESTIQGLEKNLATEWFRIEDEEIKESLLIYDASDWRKFYAQLKE